MRMRVTPSFCLRRSLPKKHNHIKSSKYALVLARMIVARQSVAPPDCRRARPCRAVPCVRTPTRGTRHCHSPTATSPIRYYLKDTIVLEPRIHSNHSTWGYRKHDKSTGGLTSTHTRAPRPRVSSPPRSIERRRRERLPKGCHGRWALQPPPPCHGASGAQEHCESDADERERRHRVTACTRPCLAYC